MTKSEHYRNDGSWPDFLETGWSDRQTFPWPQAAEARRYNRAAKSLAATREGLRRWDACRPRWVLRRDAVWARYVLTRSPTSSVAHELLGHIRQAWRERHQ